MYNFTESEIENYSLDEFKRLGFSYVPGPSIAPDREAGLASLAGDVSASYILSQKRESYEDVILTHALEQAIDKLNPTVAPSVRQEALKAGFIGIFSSAYLCK